MNTDDPNFPALGAFGWQALGYNFESPAMTDFDAQSDRLLNSWDVLLSVLAAAKSGHFSGVDRLIQNIVDAQDWVLLRASAELLGDAGSSACMKLALQRLGSLVFEPQNFVLQTEFCRSLWCSQWLWTVPVILDVHRRINDRVESSTLRVHMDKLLGRNLSAQLSAGILTDEGYAQAVLDGHQDLRARFGSDEVPVFQGELYGVNLLARYFLNALQSSESSNGYDCIDYRHRFEAATGIDCRIMFDANGVTQPMNAMSIVEQFLESVDVVNYLPGRRYFFGHEIPH